MAGESKQLCFKISHFVLGVNSPRRREEQEGKEREKSIPMNVLPGKFEARDYYLLKEVAEVLLERGEKLYVYTSGKAMIVTPDEFIAIPRKEFWMLVENGR